MHQSLKEPYLQGLVNFSCQALQLLPILDALFDSFFNILNWAGFHWRVVQFIKTHLDCGVAIEVVFSKFVISSSKFVIAFFKYGGELSSSTLLLVIKLANTRTSNFMLEANINVLYALSSTSKVFLNHFHSKINLLILLSVWNLSK